MQCVRPVAGIIVDGPLPESMWFAHLPEWQHFWRTLPTKHWPSAIGSHDSGVAQAARLYDGDVRQVALGQRREVPPSASRIRRVEFQTTTSELIVMVAWDVIAVVLVVLAFTYLMRKESQ